MADKISKVNEAIERKFRKQMGYTTIGFIIYMIAVFATICPRGYVYFDRYKVYFIYGGVGALLLVTLFLSLKNLDKVKGDGKSFFLIDYLFAATLIIWLISAIFSVDKHSAFLGDDFRRSGFLYMACMMVGAWIVFRYFVYHTVLGIVFAVWCIATNFLSILQYYGIDPFNWQIYRQVTGLKSVFGNVDQNAAMCTIQLAVLFVIIMLEKNWVTISLNLIAVAFVICGGFTDDSAGFFFSAFPVFVAIGLAVRNSVMFKRLWYAFVAMYAGFLYQQMNYTHTRDYEQYNERLTIYLFTNPKVKYLIAVLLIVMGILAFVLKNVFDKYGKYISYGWFIFFALIIVGAAIFMLYVNKHAANYGEEDFLSKFVINDRFGSGRGEIWKTGLETYRNGNVFEKLFGIGFCNVSRLELCKESYAASGQTLADLHNVYLDMLLTCGLLGAGTYFATIIALIVSAAKNLKNDFKAMVPILTASAYLAISLINFNLIVTTPIVWLALAIGHNKKSAE